MTRSKVSKKKRGNNDVEGIDDCESETCPCGKYIEEAIWIKCDQCLEWWHIECVGLKGLKSDMVNLIDIYHCPRCFESPLVPTFRVSPIGDADRLKTVNGESVSTPVDSANCNTIKLMLKEELNLVSNMLKTTVDSAMNLALKKIATKDDVNGVETNIKTGLDEVKQLTTACAKSYADAVATQQTTLIEEIKTAAPTKETVRQTIEETAQLTIDSSLVKLDADHVERKKRLPNIMVNKVAESTSKDDDVRKTLDREFIRDVLEIDLEDVVESYRAGVQRTGDDGKPIPRPLIIKMHSVALAEKLHDNGRGVQVGETQYYINADLCRADRKACFLARVERRKRKDLLEEKQRKETARQNAVRKDD